MLSTTLAAVPVTASVNAATASASVSATSGTTGSCTWKIENDTLTISGSGAMGNYDHYNTFYWAPWSGSNFSKVVIENSVTSIGDYAFKYCESLESVTIPDSVTSIGFAAFSACISLKSVTIPNSVTSIGDFAFSSCESLESVTIPNSVTSIGNAAFWFCHGLKSVTIPDSVTSIGWWAFRECDSLSEIKVEKNNPTYCSIDGNLYNKDATTLIQYAIGKTDESFVIPDSVTSIGDGAFYDCTSLESVTIPDSVTSIGDEAFYCCENLESVTIPGSVTSIGVSAFKWCESLLEIKVEKNNPIYRSIDGNLYNKDATTLIQYAIGKTDESFDIPSSVRKINSAAFNDCKHLKSVKIPDSVTSIGFEAFFQCESLKSVTIPDSVTSISWVAFGYYYMDGGDVSITKKMDDFTVIGSKGSAAEAYANKNGFSFIETGDVDGDGAVSINDATMIQFYLVGFTNLNETQLKAADVDNNGRVDISDVTRIQFVLAGLA